MIHKGKLPPIVVGELLHVINNALAPIVLVGAKLNNEDGKRIEQAAFKIANYVRSLETKSEFSNDPFNDYSDKAA